MAKKTPILYCILFISVKVWCVLGAALVGLEFLTILTRTTFTESFVKSNPISLKFLNKYLPKLKTFAHCKHTNDQYICVWNLEFEIWNNLFTFCQWNNRSKVSRATKSTILKCLDDQIIPDLKFQFWSKMCSFLSQHNSKPIRFQQS